MGYEVLDSGGAGGDTPLPLRGSTDVLALEDLPEPSSAPPPRPPGRWRSAVGRRLSALSLGRRSWVLVAMAAAAGMIVGAAFTGHHAAEVRAQEARQEVRALATTRSVDVQRTGLGMVADLSVQVFNVGTNPFTVVTPSGSDELFQPGAWRSVSGSPEVGPSDDQTLVTRVVLDCSSSEPLQVTVPARDIENGLHRITVRPSPDQGGSSQRELCASARPSDESTVQVDLRGTLARPLLRLTNTSQATAVVRVDGDTFGTPSSQNVIIDTSPAMPLTLQPGQERTVRLLLTVRRCEVASDVSLLAGSGWVGLVATTPEGQEIMTTGVDIGPLIGRAVAQTCH